MIREYNDKNTDNNDGDTDVENAINSQLICQ
jgi:hypothetical protein